MPIGLIVYNFMRYSIIIYFRLQNHTYEIIATTNPFSITCHVVNLIGAFLVFVTLSLLCFTDIGLGKSFANSELIPYD